MKVIIRTTQVLAMKKVQTLLAITVMPLVLIAVVVRGQSALNGFVVQPEQKILIGGPTPTPAPTPEPSTTTPTLGNYPDTSIPLSTNTTVAPDAAPTNTTSINVSTTTTFNGKLEGDPMTGVVRVTDAHPAGTYAVTLTAFDSDGAPTTKMFMLTVTTPATCTPVSFAAATNFGAGSAPWSVAVGEFNGDGKQDLALANFFSDNVSILLGDGTGNFSAAANFDVGDVPVSVA